MSLFQAWETLREMGSNFITTLPNIGLGIIAFALSYLAAKWVRSVVRRVAETAGLSPSATLVLGHLSRRFPAVFERAVHNRRSDHRQWF
jgi:hypothetical protein